MSPLPNYLCAVSALLTLTWAPNAIAVEQPNLPLVHDFTERIPDSWEVLKSPGAEVAVKDGLVVFNSLADREAIIRQEIGEDNISVTARIHDAASVYLVWDDNTFVGVGKISPTPFARFQSVEHKNGEIDEVDHTGCNGPAAHLVRIQLGTDCIRFQSAEGDGDRTWTTLRTIERTPEFSKPPRFVAAGKNLGVNANSAAIVKTDSVGRGILGRLARIEISRTPDAELKMSSDERRWLTKRRVDPVAHLLEETGRDPTYDEVARFYPEMKRKRDLVGVPGQRIDIGTDWLGRIDASPWEGPIAWFELGDEAIPFADKPEQVSHRLLDGYVPIVTLKASRQNTDYEMTVFGWAKDFSATEDLYTYVRLTGWSNGETANLPKSISLAGRDQKKLEFKPEITQSGRLVLCLRFKHPDPQTAESISEQEFESYQKKAENAWRDTLARCAPFSLPDQRVNEAYRAWLAYSMLNADRIDGRLHVHDGAGFYDLQFGYSVALHTMALDQYGLADYVADVLATQVHLQKPDGHYIQECGLPDQGGFVLALGTHYLITKDEKWIAANADALTNACDWILARRDEGPQEGMCRGLIKFRPYNDYNDPVFNYQGNIYCCQGLEAASRALKQVRPEAAERYRAEAAEYRKSIYDSMDAATFTHNGVKMIPIEPDTHRLLKLTNYRGGEYYGLVASTLFENEFFPKDDPRGALYINMLENEGGLTAGVCEFQEGIDHAYTCGYLLNRMRAGEIRKTLLGFWSFMAYGMTRDTYSPVEVTLYKTGINHLTLPHTYSCTQQLRLLRYMLLREEGTNLILAQGVPCEWLAPGKMLEVNEAPTLFGNVSYRIDAVDSQHVAVHIDPPIRTVPESIEVHLRHPNGASIASVDSTPDADIDYDPEVVRLTNLSAPIRLNIRFEK
jgi:hypothetical protein